MIQMPRGKRELPTHSRRVLLLAVNGSEDSETDTENSNGRMVPGMRASGKTIGHTEKENSLILMEIYMKVTGSMTRPMATEFIITLMVLCTRATGEMICSMALVKRAGRMARFMKESTWRARSME